ncbi:MAG TPA: TetR/AcrR family transcriptional regulator [Bacteroidota bacterium]
MGIQERKEREKEHRREEIVDAAQKVFFDKGLQAATMDEIAETAELSKGTLYIYYKSKEDVYLAVVMRGLQILHDMFESRIRSEGQVVKAMIGLQETYYEFFKTHRNHFRMLHYLQTPQFHRQVSDEMKQSCAVVNKKMWDLVIALIQRGIDESILVSHLNAAELGIFLWSGATQLMIRIDTESERWQMGMKIDLERVLRVSNLLMLESIMTPDARRDNEPLLHEILPRNS